MESVLNNEAIVFDPSAIVLDDGQRAPPLKLTAKRYTPRPPYGNRAEDGLIIVLTHGAGFHKEQWEPVLETLIKAHNTGSVRPCISEAWSLDWQNHGDGGLVNGKELRSRENGVTLVEWGCAIAAFLKTKKFPKARTIGIGYSAGSSSLINATSHFDVNDPPFAGIIICECAMVTREVYMAHTDLHSVHFPKVVQAMKVQRASWRNKEAALKWLKTRSPYDRWDPRMQDLYVKYALYKPRQDADELAVKCSKAQEAVTILDFEGQVVAAEQFAKLGQAKAVPIHFIFGSHYDFVPEWIPRHLFNEKDGRIPASVRRIPGVGHYILQEKPDEVAQAISDIISGELREKPSGPYARL